MFSGALKTSAKCVPALNHGVEAKITYILNNVSSTNYDIQLALLNTIDAINNYAFTVVSKFSSEFDAQQSQLMILEYARLHAHAVIKWIIIFVIIVTIFYLDLEPTRIMREYPLTHSNYPRSVYLSPIDFTRKDRVQYSIFYIISIYKKLVKMISEVTLQLFLYSLLERIAQIKNDI